MLNVALRKRDGHVGHAVDEVALESRDGRSQLRIAEALYDLLHRCANLCLRKAGSETEMHSAAAEGDMVVWPT